MAIYSEETAKYIWRNREIIPWAEATIHVNSVGHASVAGIFEGIKAYWNEDKQQLFTFRLSEHMQRFINSIKMVRFAFNYTKEELEKAVIDTLKANEFKQSVYIRPYIFQKGMVRELLQAQPGHEVELIIDSWPFDAYSDTNNAMDVCVSSWNRISDNVFPPRLKCFSNYHNGRLAAMEATVSGYDWPILLDLQGKVTEGPGACVAIVRDGKVIMPNTTSSILESITRDTVIQLLDKEGIPCDERVIDRTELYLADEVFFIGTGWEIMPVSSVDRLKVGTGKMGRITKMISKKYADVVRGKIDGYDHWLTPVW